MLFWLGCDPVGVLYLLDQIIYVLSASFANINAFHEVGSSSSALLRAHFCFSRLSALCGFLSLKH